MKEIIIKILREINPDIREGVNLIQEGRIDSFSIVQAVMELEEEFGIEIDAEDYRAENFETVDTFAALIEKYVKC